ncbi:uncharacterized protein EAE98_006085 [Botrytis deweyae]|uniref:Uncharacterized protein n=1 Tax=Botrytis deweyae TaxID=2478750 RepID=A0ABQ7ILL3_9HELO|nr:uncharacterized protein EAE98_006085 [Botrytis deweyae]KAF7927703.1 hypothetical protein EAE98_006085 [Botrytis deweyae]
MDLPKVLLIGTIYCASSEWSNLSDIAELIHLKDGDRDTFRNGCHSGHYDRVVVIIRCEDAYKYTGRFDTDLIQSLPKSVKFVCAPQVGYDQIDIDTCTIQGIAVSNSPANIGNATADATIYLLLGALRRSWISSLSIRNGQWRGHAGLGHDPEGKVLGILGMGNIGSVVAKRAAAFDMHIQYYNRNPLPVERTPPGTKYVSFEELLRTSDVISVHLPLSDDTKYTLGSNEFAQMKDGAILINTSRGPIIDEQALVEALESGKLYSAGLDVFENEPQVHPKLLANENVVLTPHMAAGTVETVHKSEALAMSNVRNALQHGTLLTQVREQRAE